MEDIISRIESMNYEVKKFITLLRRFMELITEEDRQTSEDFFKMLLRNNGNVVVTIKLIISIIIQNDQRFSQKIKETDEDFFEKANNAIVNIQHVRRELRDFEYVEYVLEFIYGRCPDLKKVDLDDEKNLVLFVGKVQSGKSELLRCIGLYYLLIKKKNVVVVLLGLIGHALQFENGLKNFSGQFSSFMREKGFETGEIGSLYTGDIVNHDDELVIPENFEEKIKEKKSFNVCLANKSQLGKIREVLTDDYVLLIDEADQVNYAENAEYMKELVELRDERKVYAITATGFEIMFREDKLKVDKIYSLSTPENYKGVPQMIMDIIEQPPKSEKEEEFYEKDFEKYYEKIKSHSIFRRDVYNCESDHPVISLHVSGMQKTEHEIIFKKLRQYGFLTLKYNGDGIDMYHKSLRKLETIELKSGKKSTTEKGIHTFTYCGIPEVLQYVKENGGAEKYPHIAIVCGKLANRGINFVSADFGWHLTHEYYLPSTTANCATLLQGLRLCGVYNDSIPLSLHAPRKAITKIQKSHHLQQELIDRIRREEDIEQIVMDALQNYTINRKKIPHGKLCKSYKPKSPLWNVTTGDDGNMENVDIFTTYDKTGRGTKGVKTIDDLVRVLIENLDKDEETEYIRLLRFLWNGRKTKRETKENCGNLSYTNHSKWGTHRNYHVVDVVGEYVELCKETKEMLEQKLPNSYLEKIKY